MQQSSSSSPSSGEPQDGQQSSGQPQNGQQDGQSRGQQQPSGNRRENQTPDYQPQPTGQQPESGQPESGKPEPGQGQPKPQPQGQPQSGQEVPGDPNVRGPGPLPQDGTEKTTPGQGNDSWGELQPYVNHLRNRGSQPKVPEKFRKYWEAYLKQKADGERK
jgi:hypothetical protein